MLIVQSIFNFTFAQKIPAWFEHSQALYPSAMYITAQGEGNSIAEAESDCLAKISMFFNTTVQVANDLLKTYKESDSAKYSFESNTEVKQSAKISSSVEFFGVQFEKPFSAKGRHYAFAYIERDAAFAVYEERIKLNSAALQTLLMYAEDYNNPIYGFEVAKRGAAIAKLTEEQIKIARIVKRANSEYFAEAESLCMRMNTALEICKKNLVFRIEVQNDLYGTIKRVLGELLETEGYNVSQTDGVCTILAKINLREENLPAGIFFYAGIEVGIMTGDGRQVFSWSRNIPKTGAPKDRREMAEKLTFQKIQKELQDGFMSEFLQKVKL